MLQTGAQQANKTPSPPYPPHAAPLRVGERPEAQGPSPLQRSGKAGDQLRLDAFPTLHIYPRLGCHGAGPSKSLPIIKAHIRETLSCCRPIIVTILRSRLTLPPNLHTPLPLPLTRTFPCIFAATSSTLWAGRVWLGGQAIAAVVVVVIVIIVKHPKVGGLPPSVLTSQPASSFWE